MFQIIQDIIQHTPSGSYVTSEEQLIYSICGVIIIIIFFVIIDLLYRVFRNFIK